MALQDEHLNQFTKILMLYQRPGTSSIDSLVSSVFASNAVFYMNGPHLPAAKGVTKIKNVLSKLSSQIGNFHFTIKAVATDGKTLFVQRVETFRYKDAHDVTIHLVGVIKIGEDGKIIEWVDYFDTTLLSDLEDSVVTQSKL